MFFSCTAYHLHTIIHQDIDSWIRRFALLAVTYVTWRENCAFFPSTTVETNDRRKSCIIDFFFRIHDKRKVQELQNIMFILLRDRRLSRRQSILLYFDSAEVAQFSRIHETTGLLLHHMLLIHYNCLFVKNIDLKIIQFSKLGIFTIVSCTNSSRSRIIDILRFSLTWSFYTFVVVENRLTLRIWSIIEVIMLVVIYI